MSYEYSVIQPLFDITSLSFVSNIILNACTSNKWLFWWFMISYGYFFGILDCHTGLTGRTTSHHVYQYLQECNGEVPRHNTVTPTNMFGLPTEAN